MDRPENPPVPDRLESLDALRGFVMLGIIGADAIGDAFRHFRGGPIGRFVALEMDHVDWAGLHAYDLIFPTFLFMVGVSSVFSLGRMVEKGGRPAAIRRILRRALILIFLGILYYGGISHGIEKVRLMGVLQRIGLCYAVAGILFLYVSPRALAGTCAGLLLGYWVLLRFVPVPGFGAGDFAEGHNLTNWIDAHFLPFRKWDGDHDPEGLLSTLPAIGTCLIGVLTGIFLKAPRPAKGSKAVRLALAGAALLALGLLWGLEFPIVKKLWTSSFVLSAGGIGLLLLSSFYVLIDVRGWRSWAQPFVWVGTNALAIYLISRVIDVGEIMGWVLGGEITRSLNETWPGLGGLVVMAAGIAFSFAICRFLYKRRIFLRL